MNTFHESGLKFQFGKEWMVIKYDGHRFYKGLSGAGLKGVDFLGISENGELVLIEVKNFRDRYELDDVNPTEYFSENLDEFFLIFIQKFKDTVRGIETIYQYYLRKWWFRNFAVWAMSNFPPEFWIRFEWGKWTLAHRLLIDKKVKLVVWLEWEEGMNLDLEELENRCSKSARKEFGKRGYEVFFAGRDRNPFDGIFLN